MNKNDLRFNLKTALLNLGTIEKRRQAQNELNSRIKGLATHEDRLVFLSVMQETSKDKSPGARITEIGLLAHLARTFGPALLDEGNINVPMQMQ